MKIQKQLTVFLENQPGMMARICEVMKEIEVNILAFNIFGTVDHGVLRMIVDAPQQALHALGDRGILVIDTDVLEVSAENKPGKLDEISRALAKANLNVEYGYGSTGGSEGHDDRFFLQITNTRKALLILKNLAIKKKKRASAPKKKTAGKTAKKTTGKKKKT